MHNRNFRRTSSNASDASGLSSSRNSIASSVPTVTAATMPTRIDPSPSKAPTYAAYFKEIVDETKKEQAEEVKREEEKGASGGEAADNTIRRAEEMLRLRKLVEGMGIASLNIARKEDVVVKQCLAMCRHLAADDLSTGVGKTHGFRVAGHLAMLRGKRDVAKALEETLQAYQADLLALENAELVRIGGEPSYKMNECSFSIDPKDAGVMKAKVVSEDA